MRSGAYLCGLFALGLIAGCGAVTQSARPSFVTVRGAYDYQGMPTQASCADLTYVISLSGIDGRKIAQQNSPATWRGGLCIFPFSFGHVRAMSLYRIDVPGGTPEAWLTPQQVAEPVLISVYDGFYIGPFNASSAADASKAGISGPCPAGHPAPAASATSPAGRALLARVLPLPADATLTTTGPAQGVLSLAGYVNGLYSGSSGEQQYLVGDCFQAAVHREWKMPGGTQVSVWLSQFLTTTDARSYILATEQAEAADPANADIFPVSRVTDGVGFGQSKLDQDGNTFTIVLGDVGNVAISIHYFVPALLDNSAAASALQQQRTLLASGSS